MHLGDPEAVPSEASTCLNEESEELGMLDIGNLHNYAERRTPIDNGHI